VITSSNSNTSGFLRFASQNSGQTPLTLDGATGSVGISNNTPAAKLDIADTTLAGSGSLAGSILNLAQTWNTTGAPTAIKLNVTNTDSGAASNLLDLQVGTVSQFKVDKVGDVTLGLRLKNTYNQIYLSPNNIDALIAFTSQVRTLMPLGFSNNGSFNDTFLRRRGVANLQIGAADDATPVAQTLSVQSVIAGATNTAGANFTIDGSQGTGNQTGGAIGFRTAPLGASGSTVNPLSTAMDIQGNGYVGFWWSGLRAMSWNNSTLGLNFGKQTPIYWSDNNAATGVRDLALHFDASNTLAQRNGVNPQAFRLYNTYTDATTFERLNIKWDTNVLKIGTEKGSVGGTARAMELQTDNTTRMTIASAGDIGIGTTAPINKLDINGDTRAGGWLHVDRTGGSLTSYFAFRARGASEAGNFGNAAGNGQFEINGVNGSGLVIGTSNGPVILGTQGSERLRITAAGLVGIGTTTPRGALDISSSNNSGLWSYLQNTDSGSYSAFAVGNNISASRFVIYTLGSTYPSTAQYQANHTLMEAAGDLFFKANNHIFYSGNVGIGTTTPSTKLEIVTTGSVDGLKLNRAADDRTAWLVDEGTGSGALYLFNGSNSNSVFITGNGNSHISSGTLGLGVSNSSAAKLDILDTTLAGSGSLAGSILNLAQTWNTTGAPTAIKLNVTNTASGAASNLLDLQVDGTTKFKISKNGMFTHTDTSGNFVGIYSNGNVTYFVGSDDPLDRSMGFNHGSPTLFLPNDGRFAWTNQARGQYNASGSADLFLSRRGAANLRIGAIDAAAPVAQTLSVQSVIAGTTNTAGANLTITGSQGTGTGIGGSIIFQTAQAGSSGSTQNALSAALTIDSNRNMTVGGPWNDFTFNVPAGGGSRSFSIKDGSTTTFQVGTNGMVVLGYLAMGASTPNPDILLQRDAANTLGLRNGVNPQTFRLYNTFTDATTFERLNIKWDTNVLKIGTEKGASGGTARAMELQTDGITRVVINSNGLTVGSLNINPTNSAIYNAVIIGFGTNTAYVASPSDGVLRITNNALTDFNRIQLGGATSSFPAIKRNGAAIQIRLADDSANAALETAGLTVVGSASVSGHFSATTKSFLIPHPTKPDKKLQYACLEGPENGVYIRGKTNEPIILLPDYWSELVDADSITVTVTPIGKPQQLFVVSQNSTSVEIGNVDGLYNYLIFAERKDVNKLQTEI
jgi:hypothetical protein